MRTHVASFHTWHTFGRGAGGGGGMPYRDTTCMGMVGWGIHGWWVDGSSHAPRVELGACGFGRIKRGCPGEGCLQGD